MINLFEKKNKVVEDKRGPKVIIEDSYLRVYLGQWLGILNSTMTYGGTSFKMVKSTNSKVLKRKYKISKDNLIKIINEVKNMFRSIGVSEDSEVEMKNFDIICKKFDTIVDGHVYDTSMLFGDVMEINQVISFKDDKSRYAYELLPQQQSNIYELKDYEVTTDKGNKFNHSLFDYSYYSNLCNDDYKLNISIWYKSVINNDENPIIKDLNNLIKGLEFPVDICDLYKKVNEIISVIGNKIVSVDLTINDIKKKDISDSIIVKNGKLVSFTITKNMYKASMNAIGEWTYEKDGLLIRENNDKTNYLRTFNKDESCIYENPNDIIKFARKDVNDIKKRVLGLIKTNEEIN